ncbi:MAG: DUF58 domain-containing protein [Burkholderiales bacterium]|nr:DUF58 domain-containing protein [Burkholderiales bacterium]
MERWLSKSRVLLGLCAVLLRAALNRQDPMVYGVFLFLAVVSFLGFVLPWLSLRSMTVRLQSTDSSEVVEGAACDLSLWIERSVPWPAFMVDIETEWEWASQRIVLRQTVPVVRAGQMPELGRRVLFPCRGSYELVAVRLSSGFPLGLVRAQHSMARPAIALHVLPQAQPVHWPLPWDVTEDPLGELATRKMGQSFELGMLRPYQQGESVGRVSWRASARVGELVIQHFQHSGSVRLRVVVDVPRAPALGAPDSAGEQAVRLAAGVCDAALANAAQLFLYLHPYSAAVQDRSLLYRALAEALPTDGGLQPIVTRVAGDAAPGEQIAVVVAGSMAQDALLSALSPLVGQACAVVVCIAMGRHRTPQDAARADALQRAVALAGFATFMEAP